MSYSNPSRLCSCVFTHMEHVFIVQIRQRQRTGNKCWSKSNISLIPLHLDLLCGGWRTLSLWHDTLSATCVNETVSFLLCFSVSSSGSPWKSSFKVLKYSHLLLLCISATVMMLSTNKLWICLCLWCLMTSSPNNLMYQSFTLSSVSVSLTLYATHFFSFVF